MNASDLERVQKPLLTEAVMFFSEQGIAKEMLFPEFEALLDGLVAATDFADETVEAVFLQINHRLHVRAAVFFTIDFDPEGNVNRLWNLPLRNMAEKAGRGPDMGGGPVRLVCLGFCNTKAYQPHLWKPGQRGGKPDLARIKQAVTRNSLGILGEDEETRAILATENLQMAAEDAWYGAGVPAADEVAVSDEKLAAELDKLRQTHAAEVAEYLRKIGELQARLRQVEYEHVEQLAMMKGEHADHLTVAQGELLDIKDELAEQQKINGLLRRELAKAQTRLPSDAE